VGGTPPQLEGNSDVWGVADSVVAASECLWV